MGVLCCYKSPEDKHVDCGAELERAPTKQNVQISNSSLSSQWPADETSQIEIAAQIFEYAYPGSQPLLRL